MEWGSSDHIAHLIATYGLLAIGVIIALESMGLPLPGESVRSMRLTTATASRRWWLAPRWAPCSVTM